MVPGRVIVMGGFADPFAWGAWTGTGAPPWSAGNDPIVIATITAGPPRLPDEIEFLGKAVRAWAPHFPPEARAAPLPRRRPLAPPPPPRPAWPALLRSFA